MTPAPRFITKPGAACVCKDCGAALELVCPNGHNPGQYILGEEREPHPGNRPTEWKCPCPEHENLRAPKLKFDERPGTGICTSCTNEFVHERRKGRRSTQCPTCRPARVA